MAGRKKTPVLNGYSREAWEAVESVRQQLGLNSTEMGARMGLSGGSFRAWRKRKEMPEAAWEEFCRRDAWRLDLPAETSKTTPRGIRVRDDVWSFIYWLGEGNYSRGVLKLAEAQMEKTRSGE